MAVEFEATVIGPELTIRSFPSPPVIPAALEVAVVVPSVMAAPPTMPVPLVAPVTVTPTLVLLARASAVTERVSVPVCLIVSSPAPPVRPPAVAVAFVEWSA